MNLLLPMNLIDRNILIALCNFVLFKSKNSEKHVKLELVKLHRVSQINPVINYSNPIA